MATFMEVKLPLVESYIDALQYHAFFSSIALINNNNFKYILSKYVNITVRSIFRPHIDFCYQGILDSSPSPLNKFQIRGKITDITEFIITALKNGNYVYVKVNEFYLPHRLSYKKGMFIHDILIYGVDTLHKLLYTYGYDDTQKLNHTKYTFNEFENSYYSLNYEWDFDLFLICENQEYCYPNFNEIMLNEFKSYYLSVNPYSEIINKGVKKETGETYTSITISSLDIYGIACYDFIINAINEHIYSSAFFDPRSFYVLRNQKKAIRDSFTLLKYVNASFKDEYIKIYKTTEICAMLYLKFEMTKDKKILSALCSRLRQIKDDEIIFFDKFLKNYG